MCNYLKEYFYLQCIVDIQTKGILCVCLAATLAWVYCIEIIDIECVLLSFFSENFVSTKWRIYKGIFGSSRLYGREFRAVARSATVFFVKQSLQKDINSRF